MLKILFLVTQSEFGGAQRYIYEVAKVLSKKYRILIAAGEGDGELFQRLQLTDSRCLQLKQMRRIPWPWQIFLAIKEIFDLLKKERPDVLFLCSTTAGLLGSIASFLCKHSNNRTFEHRTIYRIGGWAFRDPRPFWQNFIILWTEKLTARFKDIIIVNSEYDWRAAVKKRIVSPAKIFKIYNGIDPDSLNFLPKEEAKNRLAVSDTARLVGCVANFYRTKGLEYLIEAMNVLSSNVRMFELNKSNNSNIKLIIIGEGKLRPKLEAMIKKRGLENRVFLAGRVPDACKYLKAFDVFVLPSLKEGFPWIILEAMAAELPIVATKVGALPEIIENGKEGFLVEPKNSRILAEKIKWLLENPREAKVMGIQAKAKLVKEFSLPKMVQETEKLFTR